MADVYTNPANLAVRPNRTFYSALDGLNEANDRSLQLRLNQIGYDKQKADAEEFAKNATLRDLTRQAGELEQQGKLASLPYTNQTALAKAQAESSPDYLENYKRNLLTKQQAEGAKDREVVANANMAQGLRASAGFTEMYADPKTRNKAIANWKDAYKSIDPSVAKWAGFTGDLNKDIEKIAQLKQAGVSDPETLRDMAKAAQKAGYDYKQAIDVANIHAAAQLGSARISASSAGVSPLSTDKLFAQFIQGQIQAGKMTPQQGMEAILQKGGMGVREGTLNLNTQKEQFDRVQQLYGVADKMFPLAAVSQAEAAKRDAWVQQQIKQNPVVQAPQTPKPAPVLGTKDAPIKLQ